MHPTQSEHRDYSRMVMMTYINRINDSHYLVNMDEMVVCLSLSPKRTVHLKR